MTIDWHELLDGFARKRVLLIGDTILDIYTYGTALGLSAETPTIVARKGEVRYSLGGAALVCRNLLELGAAVSFITLVGEDEEATQVAQLAAPKLELITVAEPGRQTTVKHRFWVDGYKLFQLDTRNDAPIGRGVFDEVMTNVARRLPETDAAIISDYRHGLLTPELIDGLMGALRRSGTEVYVDSQVAQNTGNHRLYRGGAVICLNLKEAYSIDPEFEPQPRVGAFVRLRRELETERIVVKLGEAGAMMLDGNTVVQSPATPIEPVDTTGAGDAFLAALCLCGGAVPEAALRVANAWAGLSIRIHGTAPPSKSDLPKALGLT
ncbi:MAG TPA: PfkB family carbohydrate kinase [Stellaceae bacterium]|nr:PfkB family carbohydrate kinase [Stellaceae bacterium]